MSRLKAKLGKSRDVSNGTLIGPNFFSSSALSLRADAHFLPASNFLTTSVYTDCQHDAPGIGFLGKKTWTPGKNLMKFIAATFGIPDREQSILLEAISDSVAETVPLVRDRMAEQPLFRDIGKRMLLAWQDGSHVVTPPSETGSHAAASQRPEEVAIRRPSGAVHAQRGANPARRSRP